MVETVNNQPKNPEIAIEGLPVVEFYPLEGKVRFLDVSLDVLPLPDDISARRFIPSWENMKKSTCWDTPTIMLIRDMAIRLNAGISSRNEGPTGVSKSFAAEVICAITNRNYLRHNYSKESDIGDTIGRFVPADSKVSMRFEELLLDPDLTDEGKTMINQATKENRPLTLYESKKIAAILSLPGLDDDAHWRWKNGSLTGSMVYGSVFGADEANLAPGNITERENPAIEGKPTLRIVEHEGEVVRSLTPAEQSIIDKGGIIPGVIGLKYGYWYCAAQNPYGIGGGRFEESEARRNRLQDRIVEALTPKDYKDFMNYLIHGDQPDIIWQNRKYKGDKNMPTKYRDLEQISNVDVLINGIAEFQDNLIKLTELGKIGTEKDIRGGSYVFTRRNIIRFLDSIKGAQGCLLDVEETTKQKKPVLSTNWHDLVIEAIYQEYLSGMYKEDQEVVREVIKASGIEDFLGESKNNPKPPRWVEQARKKGIDPARKEGGWAF